jgi:hypothetical protein
VPPDPLLNSLLRDVFVFVDQAFRIEAFRTDDLHFIRWAIAVQRFADGVKDPNVVCPAHLASLALSARRDHGIGDVTENSSHSPAPSIGLE